MGQSLSQIDSIVTHWSEFLGWFGIFGFVVCAISSVKLYHIKEKAAAESTRILTISLFLIPLIPVILLSISISQLPDDANTTLMWVGFLCSLFWFFLIEYSNFWTHSDDS